MPTSNLQPADYVPAFTWVRLIAVAKLLFQTRVWVAEQATPERGDKGNLIGLRAWMHGKHAIAVAAANELGAWLSIVDDGAKFIFAVGGAPIRFYRGDSDEPVPENYGDPEEVEREQLDLFFAANAPGIAFDGYYRMIVVADRSGFPTAVFLAGIAFADNMIRMAWEIPLDADASGLTPITVPQTPVPLPPLTVLTLAEQADAAREEAEREEREREAQKRTEEETDTETKGA